MDWSLDWLVGLYLLWVVTKLKLRRVTDAHDDFRSRSCVDNTGIEQGSIGHRQTSQPSNVDSNHPTWSSFATFISNHSLNPQGLQVLNLVCRISRLKGRFAGDSVFPKQHSSACGMIHMHYLKAHSVATIFLFTCGNT